MKGGTEWPFVAGGGPGDWKGSASLLKPSFQKASCNLRFHIEYDDNVMVLRIPSRCLKKPRWVRLAFGSIHRDKHGKIFEDEAFNGGWSPRVHRGPWRRSYSRAHRCSQPAREDRWRLRTHKSPGHWRVDPGFGVVRSEGFEPPTF